MKRETRNELNRFQRVPHTTLFWLCGIVKRETRNVKRAKSLPARPSATVQNGSTDEIFSLSLGLCGASICGPNEIICIPGYFSPITPHSRPACIATSFRILAQHFLVNRPRQCARCRSPAPASIPDIPPRAPPRNLAMRKIVATMRAASCLALAIALRWLRLNLHPVVFRRYHRQVRRRLHQPRNVRTHRQHAMVLARQQLRNRARIGVAQNLLPGAPRSPSKSSAPDRTPPVRRQSPPRPSPAAARISCSCAPSITTVADASRGIALRLLPPSSDATATGSLSSSSLHHAPQNAHRVAAALVNVDARVPAQQTRNLHAPACARGDGAVPPSAAPACPSRPRSQCTASPRPRYPG